VTSRATPEATRNPSTGRATDMTVTDVLIARNRIAPYIRRTPLVRSAWLSDLLAGDVWLKLESLQVSNSFKSRGAYNAVARMVERGRRECRLVTASAGNHGRALAAAAHTFDLPLVVFTPRDAPEAKLAAIRRHGAELIADSQDYDDAERRAKAHALESDAVFVSPYNDADVIAGAATIALEILGDLPCFDVAIVPIGGGGLISGIASALKAVVPATRVVGVEAEASCAFQTSIRAGRLVEITPKPTLADGLGGNPDRETITFGFVQRFVDDIVTVSEHDLEESVRGLAAYEHLIVEGAGAASVAAVAAGRIDLKGRRTVAVVSGANIDAAKLTSVLVGH